MGNLFYGCNNLLSIDLSNFKTTNNRNLKSFFNQCFNLIYIDISNFDTSKVTDMSYFFKQCINLKSINLGEINTSLVKNMEYFFSQAENLESLDLTSFDTSSVTSMRYMFLKCYSIKTIKFPEVFNTSQVVSMHSMFSNCQSLISLNLSNFDTSKVTQMISMFENCHNLKYLDIPNFAPLNIKSIKKMFYNMTSLIFLNIHSFEINENTDKSNSIAKLPSELKVCSNQTNMQNYLVKNKKQFNCSDICFIRNIKIDLNTNECINSCKEHGYNHECNNICYNECPEDTHVIIKNISNKDNIFVEFDDGIVICLDRNPEGYYLDEDGFYEECYERCKFCYGPGNERNNSCKKCKSNYLLINDVIYNTNCYEKCKYYYYFNESDYYFCTENENCSGIYDKLVVEKSRCVDNCGKDNIFKYEYNNICYKECPKETIYNKFFNICLEEDNIETTFIIDENINNFSSIISYLIDDSYTDQFFNFSSSIETSNCQNLTNQENIFKTELIIKGNNEEVYHAILDNVLKNYDISKGGDMVYKGENNFFFHLTNTENELGLLKGKNNNTNKLSIIDLGECGNLLKRHYNIN